MKKYLALLLTMVMSVSVLAGCGGGSLLLHILCSI